MKHSFLLKIYLLLIFFSLVMHLSYAQKTEVKLNAYSGLFSFHGSGSASISSVQENSYSSSYTLTPYGRNTDFSYAAELQLQRINPKRHLLGIGVGFEELVSQVKVDTVRLDGIVLDIFPVTGKTMLKNSFFILNPFVGQRFLVGKTIIDLSTGLDLSFCLKSIELVKTSKDNINYAHLEKKQDHPFVDVRPRIQIDIRRQRIGVIAGYSLGLTNYRRQPGSTTYTSFLRCGISYQLK